MKSGQIIIKKDNNLLQQETTGPTVRYEDGEGWVEQEVVRNGYDMCFSIIPFGTAGELNCR